MVSRLSLALLSVALLSLALHVRGRCPESGNNRVVLPLAQLCNWR
jgi:hypothetical protein